MKFSLSIAMCDPSHYLPLAVAAEEAGWDGVVVPDSPFFPEVTGDKYPYSDTGARYWGPETPFLDPWVVIPAMAAVTSRLRLFPGVLKLPIRNPLLVAKSVGSAAALAPGRIALGVGVSWMEQEFQWCGQNFATRGPRTDEAIEAIRLLLTGDMVEYHGAHYDFGPVQMTPGPAQPVDIYVGGMSSPALRRAARLGDGWYSMATSPEVLSDAIGKLTLGRHEYGRERVPFEIFGRLNDELDQGSIRRMIEIGVTHGVVKPWTVDEQSAGALADKIASLRRYAELVIEPMRSEVVST